MQHSVANKTMSINTLTLQLIVMLALYFQTVVWYCNLKVKHNLERSVEFESNGVWHWR